MTEHSSEIRSELTITIDAQRHQSPTPTTGNALYALGGVRPNHTLYREQPNSEHEDPAVRDNDSEIHLHVGEKFYSEPNEEKEFEIIIDRKRVRSPKETTGASLYVLGSVPANYILYRETNGPDEDHPIPNDATHIRVCKDEKFYSSLRQVTPGARR
jgi:hypothetical protein